MAVHAPVTLLAAPGVFNLSGAAALSALELNSATGIFALAGGSMAATVSSAPVTVPALAPSPSGSVIGSPFIVNAQGLWVLSGGCLYLNGAPAGFTAQVLFAIVLQGILYQCNVAGNWWSWIDGGWVSTPNPL